MSKRDSLRDRLQNKSIQVPMDRIRYQATETGTSTASAATAKKVNRNVEYQAIKGDLHERLIDELNQQGAQRGRANKDRGGPS